MFPIKKRGGTTTQAPNTSAPTTPLNQTHIIGPHTRHTKHTAAATHTYHWEACVPSFGLATPPGCHVNHLPKGASKIRVIHVEGTAVSVVGCGQTINTRTYGQSATVDYIRGASPYASPPASSTHYSNIRCTCTHSMDTGSYSY